MELKRSPGWRPLLRLTKLFTTDFSGDLIHADFNPFVGHCGLRPDLHARRGRADGDRRAELCAELMLAARRLSPRFFRASRKIYSTRGAENQSGARNCCIARTSSGACEAVRVPMASTAPPSPARKALRLPRMSTSAYSWCTPNQFLLMHVRKLSLALNSITCRLVVEISIFLQISSDDRPITSRIENTSASRLDIRWQHC